MKEGELLSNQLREPEVQIGPIAFSEVDFQRKNVMDGESDSWRVNVGKEEDRNKLEFCPGTIHLEKFREFWRSTLKASPWVMEFLSEGYRIPFDQVPGPYEEDNNGSALKNMKIVRCIVDDMIKLGIARQVSVKPKCVSPLGLVSRVQSNGKMKHRLVFDASRWLNKCITDQKVTLSHLEKALLITERNDWQVVFDLKSAYYHIKIREDQHELLGAAVQQEDGSKLYFVYQHLPFGLKCAVHAITKIWKPLIAFLQCNGIRSSIYIDDGRILAVSKEEAEKFRVFAYDMIEKAGWMLEREKSDKENDASQVKTYLGFEVNTANMTVSKNESKLEEILEGCRHAMKGVDIKVKDLSSVLGRITALIASHGHLARFCTRSGYVDIAQHVDKFGWKGRCEMSVGCRKELLFFIQFAHKFNGFPIRTILTAVRIDSILDNAKASKGTVQAPTAGEVVRMVSDSSSFKAAVIFLDSKMERKLDFPFTEEEKSLSSGVRELLAVQKAVHLFRFEKSMMNKLIYWFTDSTNVVSFLEKGSSRRHVQDIVLDIAIQLAELNSWIQPIHLFRSDDRVNKADAVSKFADSDDWSMDNLCFQRIKDSFRLKMGHDLVVDMFASKSNARFNNYFSKYFEEGCNGVDAFAQVWQFGMWMCPPVNDLARVANELEIRRGCSGAIVIPEWPTANFYGRFFTKSGVRPPFGLLEKVDAYIYQNQGAKGALCGKINFSLIILCFSV